MVVNEDKCLKAEAEATRANKQDMERCDAVVNPQGAYTTTLNLKITIKGIQRYH